jgi:hypothetical protein
MATFPRWRERLVGAGSGSAGFQSLFSGNSLEILWKFSGNSVEILWKFSGNSVDLLLTPAPEVHILAGWGEGLPKLQENVGRRDSPRYPMHAGCGTFHDGAAGK